MKLEQSDLLFLRDKAIEAARSAGALIAEYANRPVEVKTKANAPSRAASVVTEVDLLSQKAILNVLAPTCEKYDLALLTEESPDDRSRLEKDAFWCIDPMDGTLCFVEKMPGYAVSIGLTARSGEPLIGVIFDVVNHVLYHAVKGEGAFRNGVPFRIQKQLSGGPLSFISDINSVENPRLEEMLRGLEAIAEELGLAGVDAQFQGGAAMCACWVMERPAACYFKFPKPQDGGGSLWDYAASACIAQEAGAVVSDCFGAPLDLNRPDSTYMNHRGMIYSSHSGLAAAIERLRSRLCD